jgi:hypothetical protein
VENFVLSDELAKQKLTLQDINEFLTNELKARSLATAQARYTQQQPCSSHCCCCSWQPNLSRSCATISAPGRHSMHGLHAFEFQLCDIYSRQPAVCRTHVMLKRNLSIALSISQAGTCACQASCFCLPVLCLRWDVPAA